MVLLLVIFILKTLEPSQEWLNLHYKNLAPNAVETIVNAGLVDKFSEIGRLGRSLLFVFCGLELIGEFFTILKSLPLYFKWRAEKRQNRPTYDKQMMDNISEKLKNNWDLTRKERKFFNSYMNKDKRKILSKFKKDTSHV